MRKIVFLTGTRADFGKIKSLILALESHPEFEPYIFVTGMHLLEQYGYTVIEIERCEFSNIHTFLNHTDEATMDLTLAKTIQGFSEYIKDVQPDLIVVHGDRVEALAGAIVGSLNNILVAHIEGGEVSGTVDELIRHSVSKMSHIHYVSNDLAKQRLLQMGEIEASIKVIGSPDLDIMCSEGLPLIEEVKDYYDIPFDNYAIAMFHPVTTEYDNMATYAENFVSALLADDTNYVVVFPNNDLGSARILEAYNAFVGNPRFRVFPSIRFEYFLILLKHAQFIIGNSSAGIREAPYYDVPTINIGTRQANRSALSQIIQVDYSVDAIVEGLHKKPEYRLDHTPIEFGAGNSAQLFLESVKDSVTWSINKQKQFVDFDR